MPQNTILTLNNGAARAELIPSLGGRIASCVLPKADQPNDVPVAVLHPFPTMETQVEHWAKGGIYPLVPYWGRIANSTLHFAGTNHALTPYPDAVPHTLHGIAQRRSWQVQAHAESSATLTYQHTGDDHWPWPFEATLTVELHRSYLRVRLALKNTSEEAFPGGVGFHPYLPSSALSELQFRAPCMWEATTDYLALRQATVPTDANFSAGRVLGDVPFTGLYQHWQSPLSLKDVDGSQLMLSASENLDHLVVHRPAGMPYVCIEPVSHTADAFNLHARHVPATGTRILAPGEVMSGEMSISWAA